MSTPENFPVLDDLAELDQWGVWRRENGTKVPYSVTGRKASSTDPGTWATLAEALDVLSRQPGRWAGLAWFFHEADPYVGIDLDDSLDEHGNVIPWAAGIVAKFSDTYQEISPSGRGLKIWCRGSLPSAVGKVRVGDGGIELYDRERFFAVTGRRYRRAPMQIEDHSSDLRELYDHLQKSKGNRWTLQPIEGGRIPHGQQHLTLVSILGTLRARRICDEAILACLLIVNERQCERPGARENIERMVRSSRRWGATA